jgi:hypothetical protein
MAPSQRVIISSELPENARRIQPREKAVASLFDFHRVPLTPLQVPPNFAPHFKYEIGSSKRFAAR